MQFSSLNFWYIFIYEIGKTIIDKIDDNDFDGGMMKRIPDAA